MSDDFGTMSVRRGERAREIEVLRQHYRTHRDSINRLAADAPTEVLAAEYHRLIGDIDGSLRKLDELEGRTPVSAPTPAASAPPSAAPRVRTSPGQRPLMSAPDTSLTPEAPNSSSRVILIVLAGVVVLGLIGWLIWRASSERPVTGTRPVIEQPVSGTTNPEPINPTIVPAITPAPVPTSVAVLKVTPPVQDYGIIRRGTRAVRQFEVTNNGATPLTIEVARSGCRCLYYDYNKRVPARQHETITVTVDAARAKSATVDEQIAVTAKGEPRAVATFGVRAVIR